MSHPLRDTIPAGKCAKCGHYGMVGEVTKCRCGCEPHTGEPEASPYQGYEPHTPAGAEAALDSFMSALDAATEAYEAAANAEVDAEDARDAARDRALLSDECPRAAGPDRTCTVAERDAWIRTQTRDEERAWKLAKVATEIAKKRFDKVGRQTSALQSISRSVSTDYRGTGGHR